MSLRVAGTPAIKNVYNMIAYLAREAQGVFVNFSYNLYAIRAKKVLPISKNTDVCDENTLI